MNNIAQTNGFKNRHPLEIEFYRDQTNFIIPDFHRRSSLVAGPRATNLTSLEISI